MSEEVMSEKDLIGEEETTVEPAVDEVLLAEVIKKGVLTGLRHSKTNPKMRPYIALTRSGVEVFDFSRIMEALEKACAFLAETIRSGGVVLVVGTEPIVRNLVKPFAERYGLPHVVERWLGGTLTNFKTIYTRLQYYLKIKADSQAGRLDKYTKKERLGFEKQVIKMSPLFSGLEMLKSLPNAVLVLNATYHETAIREATKMNIPIVAVMNTDGRPDAVRFPVPANDRSQGSIAWILERFGAALELGARERLQIVKQKQDEKETAQTKPVEQPKLSPQAR